MKKLIQINTNYQIRTETHQGKEYLVVPVVMMTEGVHSGSHGALFHSIAELGKYPASWDGMPVTVSHPQRNGGNVSANSPEVIDTEAIGRVYNTHVSGEKLKAEAWLEKSILSANHVDVLAAIRNQRPLDVSVGVFTDEEENEGEYNGEQYTSIAYSHRPDHLALLPGDAGACSWADGCGIRNNKINDKKGGNQKMKNKEKDLAKKRFATIQINEQGFRELTELVQRKLDAMDTDTSSYFLEEMYEDYFVYRVSVQEAPTKYYKRNYKIQEDETVEFVGEPVRIAKKIEYNEISNNKFKRTKGVKNNMSKKEEKKPCCPDKVNELIANKQSNFTDEDKEWLSEQDEVNINKMFPKEPEKKEVKDVKVNKEEAVNVLKETLKTPEDFFALMPDEMQDQMKAGLVLHNQNRKKLQKTILDNAKEDTWTEDELKTMSTDMLKKIASSFNVEDIADYSGSGSGKLPTEDTEEALLPIGVNEEKEDK